MSRFRSLWKDKCRPELADDPRNRAVAGLRPVELMDYIETYPFGNAHWFPQWAYLIPGAELISYKWLHQVVGLPKTHIHRGQVSCPIEDVPIDRVLRHYARDVELWKQAEKRFVR